MGIKLTKNLIKFWIAIDVGILMASAGVIWQNFLQDAWVAVVFGTVVFLWVLFEVCRDLYADSEYKKYRVVKTYRKRKTSIDRGVVQNIRKK